MSRTFLFDSLKAHIKARGMNYKELAQALNLSEGSLKRIFSKNDCTLQRLDEICQILNIELKELVKTTPPKRILIQQLTHAQEQELVDNKKLLMLAVCSLSLWTFKDMLSHLTLSKQECIVLMQRLEKIGFLHVLGGNHYKLLVAKNFTWIPDGPIMRMTKKESSDYFAYTFDAPQDLLKIINVRISPKAHITLKTLLEHIAQEYADQGTVDSNLPLEDRTPLSICIAVRSWVPHFLRHLLKET
jgi:DNA-binding Xre family transcriptional regulator